MHKKRFIRCLVYMFGLWLSTLAWFCGLFWLMGKVDTDPLDETLTRVFITVLECVFSYGLFYLVKVEWDILKSTSEFKSGTERLLMSLSFWIPRRDREAFVGDLMEDIHEIRGLGKSELRIRIHIIWQLVMALRMLKPTTILNTVRRILNTK